MRILFASGVEKGHLHPMIGVAQHLIALGDEVAWVTVPTPSEQLRRVGIRALPVALDAPPHVTGGAELARLVRDPDALARWIRVLLLDAVPPQIEPLRQVFRDYAPDLIALDPMLYQGVIAAHLEGIPWAGLSSSLNPVTPPDADAALVRTVRALSADRDALFAAHGLEADFRVCDCLSPWLTVVFATEAYVGPAPPGVMLAGPAAPLGLRGDEPDFPWHRLDDRPLVYTSFGSQISWQPEIYAVLAEACRDLGVQLVISAGELAERPPALAGDPCLVRYAPQRALLERASVFVTHGGANSVMEALCAGVPMLMSPVCNDQELQAGFLTRSGAGLALDLFGSSARTVRELLAALLGEGSPERHAARRIQRSYATSDGSRDTALALHSIARR